jgi:hypothetical protein
MLLFVREKTIDMMCHQNFHAVRKPTPVSSCRSGIFDMMEMHMLKFDIFWLAAGADSFSV